MKAFFASTLIFVFALALAGVCAGLDRAGLETALREKITDACLAKHPDFARGSVIVNLDISDATVAFLAKKGGKLDFAIANEYAGLDPIGDVIIPVHVIVDGVRKEKLQVRSRVEVWMDVVTSANKMIRGSVIEPSDVVLAKKNVTGQGQKYFGKLDDVAGKQVTVTIARNVLVQDWMVRVPPLVSKNDQVMLIAEMPSFTATAAGIALDDGSIGDRIKVRNKDTNKEIFGKVISRTEVAVLVN
jgi:flagella basal body P-ring formation protein FlgA